ncbi:MAG TPA: RDD family protein [Mycobacteriales bacterium]|nr:RDD family protein [Mycobacteriales bacterium]
MTTAVSVRRDVLAPDRLLPVTTPEGVGLRLEVAGVGARGLAALFDLVLGGLALLVVAAAKVDVLAAPRPAWRPTDIGWIDAALRDVWRGSVAGLVILIAFPLLCELVLGGRTPGKIALHLRVLTLGGDRPDGVAIAVRNLLRLVDLLPGTYAVGALLVGSTARAQRVGDLAAGTTVVRVRTVAAARAHAYTPWMAMGPPRADGETPSVEADSRTWDLRALTPAHTEVLQIYAARRWALPPMVRATYGAWLADVLRRCVRGADPALPPETFLDALLARVTSGAPVGRR